MKLKLIIFILCWFVHSSFVEKKELNTNTYYNYGVPLNQLLPTPYSKNSLSVLVQKSSYTVYLKYDGRLVKSYPCVFGEDPIQDKRMRGDMRTPEGDFQITEIREHFIWGYFLEIDYPNHHSWEKHNQAKEYQTIPSHANIGGDVGFHGVADGLESYIDIKNNWTEGCVSLKNADVTELANYLKVGTPIKIVY